MMIRQYAFYILLLSCSNILYSQQDPLIWGDVPKADLVMEVYEEDTTAAVIVLCDYGRMVVEDEENQLRYTRHRRLKILKESGFDYGDVFIPYYSYDKIVQIGNLKAQTINPDGSTYTLKKKDFFRESINKEFSSVKFAFPNIQVGSVIEYSYEEISKQVSLLPTWYFQEEIPVRWSELRVFFSNKFSYTYLFEGNLGMRQRSEGDLTILEGESGLLRFKDRSFIMHNGVAMKEEPFITTMEDYKARIRFQLDSYMTYQGQLLQVLSSWEVVAKELESNPFFGQQYNKKKYYKQALSQLQPYLVGMQTEEQKVKAVYTFLANQMNWTGEFDMFARENINEVFEKRQGNSAEINLLFVALLKAIGIDAYPMLTSSRDHGKMYEKYPMLHQFNHVLVFVDGIKEKWIIDVPSSKRPMDLPMIASLNGRGVVIKKEIVEWLPIPSKLGKEVFVFKLNLDEDGVMEGTMNGAYKGYNAIPERQSYKKDDKGKHWKKRFSNNYPEAQVGVSSLENLDNVSTTFMDNLNITIPDAAVVVDDFMYFSPIVYSGFQENIFDLEKRYFPVDFPYPFNEQIVSTINIPEGFEVEEIPESANLALPNKGGTFKFAVEVTKEGTIRIVSNLKVKQLRFAPIEYLNLKELFDLVTEKYGEQIVLKRKQ